MRQKRGNIGRDIAAVGIDRNDKRAVLADGIYLIGTVIKNYCERIRTSQTVKCGIYGFYGRRKAAIFAVDKVCRAFGVRIAHKFVAIVFEFLFQFDAVVDYSVMDKRKRT